MSDLMPILRTVLRIAPTVFVGLTVGLVFLMTPLANILNIVTIPLGYKFSSCPNCPAFGIEKLKYSECAYCGKRTADQFGSAWYIDGESYQFCDSNCLDNWEEVEEISNA